MAGMDAVQLDIDKVLEDIMDKDSKLVPPQSDDDSDSKSTVSRAWEQPTPQHALQIVHVAF